MAWALGGFIALIGAGLPPWLLLSTRCTLGHGPLLVQGGSLKWRVPVAEITRITPTSNLLSSPAPSRASTVAHTGCRNEQAQAFTRR